MTREERTGMEVARISRRLGAQLGCWTCGIGKAIDTVGRAAGEPPYDWAGVEAKRAGQHVCKNTTWQLREKITRPVGSWEWAYGRFDRVGKYQGSDATVITDAEKNAAVNSIRAKVAAYERTPGEDDDE